MTPGQVADLLQVPVATVYGDQRAVQVVPLCQDALKPASRAQIVKLLVAALVADVRRGTGGLSGVAPGGSARTVVGRLHPPPVTDGAEL